jgi:hypothetical protein
MNRTAMLKQLSEVEGKLHLLRAALERLPEDRQTHDVPGSDARNDDQPPRVRFLDKRLFSPVVDETFAKMQVHGAPIGAEKVQALMAASGVSPEANVLSHSLIEMREE